MAYGVRRCRAKDLYRGRGPVGHQCLELDPSRIGVLYGDGPVLLLEAGLFRFWPARGSSCLVALGRVDSDSLAQNAGGSRGECVWPCAYWGVCPIRRPTGGPARRGGEECANANPPQNRTREGPAVTGLLRCPVFRFDSPGENWACRGLRLSTDRKGSSAYCKGWLDQLVEGSIHPMPIPHAEEAHPGRPVD